MSVRVPTATLHCVIMTTGLPTPPAAPTGLSNGQITEGEPTSSYNGNLEKRAK
jgi:hypothetical protein